MTNCTNESRVQFTASTSRSCGKAVGTDVRESSRESLGTEIKIWRCSCEKWRMWWGKLWKTPDSQGTSITDSKRSSMRMVTDCSGERLVQVFSFRSDRSGISHVYTRFIKYLPCIYLIFYRFICMYMCWIPVGRVSGDGTVSLAIVIYIDGSYMKNKIAVKPIYITVQNL